MRPAYGYCLIGDKGWTPDNTSWPNPDYKGEKISLANKNGWVRLEDPWGELVDIVGWGSGAAVYEGSPYAKGPSERYSLERYVPGLRHGEQQERLHHPLPAHAKELRAVMCGLSFGTAFFLLLIPLLQPSLELPLVPFDADGSRMARFGNLTPRFHM